jgi:hypothetical protein
MQSLTKQCIKCGIIKDRSEFRHNSYCRPCHSKYSKEYFKTYKRDKRSQLLTAAKKRAIIKEVCFDIDKEDIVIPDRCPLLGIVLKTDNRLLCDNSPSLDQIVPGLGYIKGNIWVISYRANRIKSNATPKELIQIGEGLAFIFPEQYSNANTKIQNQPSQKEI